MTRALPGSGAVRFREEKHHAGDRAHRRAADERARALLLDALGGKLPSAPKAGTFATGTETGTSEILGEFRPARGVSGKGDAILLGLAAAATAGGLWLSHRWRPPHTIRELEHRDAGEES
ncbi:hypothetical protein [Streptomyces sp. YIM S03343]